MNKRVIVDTGVLVAIHNKNDQYHNWAIQALSTISPHMLTCEAVISESCFILHDFQKRNFLFQWMNNGALQIAFHLPDHTQLIDLL